MGHVSGYSADELYKELWHHMVHHAFHDKSRNGLVWTVPTPTVIHLRYPDHRVLFNEARDANPFFHLAEVVWMFSGSKDVKFIELFNKRYREYSNDGIVHGAYGHRWINHFGIDQIEVVGEMLQENNNDRRAIIGMWSPEDDLDVPDIKDVPCNTQVLPRVVQGKLDMLVINRSNDMVWGMMGANIVHFTYLQEVLAHMIGVPMGSYRAITNNLHVYPDMPRYDEIKQGGIFYDPAPYPQPSPILLPGEAWQDLREDCMTYVWNPRGRKREEYRTRWFKKTAWPMMEAYQRGGSIARNEFVSEVEADDWRTAAQAWLRRRRK